MPIKNPAAPAAPLAKKAKKVKKKVKPAVKMQPIDPKVALLRMMGRVRSGLVIVSVSDLAILPSVRGALERQLRLGGSKTGLRFPPKKPVTSLYAGEARRAERARALSSAQVSLASMSKHEFLAVGTRDGFAWCTDEGLHALLPIIQGAKDGWLTLAQPSEGLSATTLVDAVLRIRGAAKKARSYVMLFLVAQKSNEALRLEDFCDDYVVVERCELEPGAVATFSVVCPSMVDLHDLGFGKAMCTAKFDGVAYTWAWEYFVSPKLQDRVIWKLRTEGKHLDEIGEIVGLHKSNVHRRLAHLPSPRPVDLPKHWLKSYTEVLGLKAEQTEAGETTEAGISGNP